MVGCYGDSGLYDRGKHLKNVKQRTTWLLGIFYQINHYVVARDISTPQIH
jgi:hypothetical protein